MGFDPAVRAYYDRGREHARLRSGAGRLEFERTKELIERFLPPGPLDVLDVGGGPGAYASWLQGEGHRVRLVEPIQLHVDQAVASGIDAELGDARELGQPDASFDVVLLLGPLYHLPNQEERHEALTETLRVLRRGGVLFAAGISRHAALLDLLVNLDKIHEPGVLELVQESVRTGVFPGPGEAGLFTTAYFHLPDALAAEVADAGFVDARVFHVEGPGFLVQDLDDRLDDPDRREGLLAALRLVEDDQRLVASSHLLAVARAPSNGESSTTQ